MRARFQPDGGGSGRGRSCAAAWICRWRSSATSSIPVRGHRRRMPIRARVLRTAQVCRATNGHHAPSEKIVLTADAMPVSVSDGVAAGTGCSNWRAMPRSAVGPASRDRSDHVSRVSAHSIVHHFDGRSLVFARHRCACVPGDCIADTWWHHIQCPRFVGVSPSMIRIYAWVQIDN